MSEFIISAFSDEISSNLDTQIRVLKEQGISYTDIRGVDGKNISEYSPEEVKTIKQRLDDGGIKTACIGSPLGKIHVTEEFAPHLELCRKLCESANILETKNIRVFSFYIPQGDRPELWRSEVLDRMNQMTEAAKEQGITLLLENEKDVYGDIPERFLDVLKSLDRPNLRAVFDPANFVQCGSNPYPDVYELVKDYVAYIHIKDALRSDGSNVPAGMGDGCIPDLLKELNRAGYKGFLTLEPHLTMFDGLAGLELHLNKKFETLKKDNGEETFAVAVSALQGIINSIETKQQEV